MNPEQILNSIIASPAFSQGLHDALHVGRYDQDYHDRAADDSAAEGANYKRAYDLGITLYSLAEGLDEGND